MKLNVCLLCLFVCLISQLISCGQAGNLYLPKNPPPTAGTQVHE